MTGRCIFWASASSGWIVLALAALAAWEDAWHAPPPFRAGDWETLDNKCNNDSTRKLPCRLYLGFTIAQFVATAACAIAMVTVLCASFRPPHTEGAWRYATVKSFGSMAGVLLVSYAAAQWVAFMLVAAIKSDDEGNDGSPEYKLGRTFVMAVVGCFLGFIEALLLFQYSSQAGEGPLRQCCCKLYTAVRGSDGIEASNDPEKIVWENRQSMTSPRVYPSLAKTVGSLSWSGYRANSLSFGVRNQNISTASCQDTLDNTVVACDGDVAAAGEEISVITGTTGGASIVSEIQTLSEHKTPEQGGDGSPTRAPSLADEAGAMQCLCSPTTENEPRLKRVGADEVQPPTVKVLHHQGQYWITPSVKTPAGPPQGLAQQQDHTVRSDITAKPRYIGVHAVDESSERSKEEAETKPAYLPTYNECVGDAAYIAPNRGNFVVAVDPTADGKPPKGPMKRRSHDNTAAFLGPRANLEMDSSAPTGGNNDNKSRSQSMEDKTEHAGRPRESSGTGTFDGQLPSLGPSCSGDFKDDTKGSGDPPCDIDSSEFPEKDADLSTFGRGISFIDSETSDVDLTRAFDVSGNALSLTETQGSELPTFAEYLEDIGV